MPLNAAENYVDRDPADHPGAGRPADSHERFTSLLLKNHANLMSVVLSLLPNWADSEDVMQQASLIMWRKFNEYQPEASFLAWAIKIVRYEALNHYRKTQNDKHLFQIELLDLLVEESMNDVSILEQERHALRGCLEKINRKARLLLESCYQSGSSFTDVARKIGCSPNSVYKNLNRIREVLLACVQRALRTERS